MTTNRSWTHFPPTYRAHEVSVVADWIIRGVSGSVVGLPGVGKSNFLGSCATVRKSLRRN